MMTALLAFEQDRKRHDLACVDGANAAIKALKGTSCRAVIIILSSIPEISC